MFPIFMIGARRCWFAVAMLAILPAGGLADDAPSRVEDDKRALAALQAYVGQWRGVGQLKRGSSQGAWTEQFQWAWSFHDGRASLVGELSGDKYFSRLELQAGDKPGQFVLLATPVDKNAAGDRNEPDPFGGTMADDALILTADKVTDDRPARISVRLVAGGDRMVMLYERRLGESTWSRLAEVGSTRKGGSFAKLAAGGPECVVTGGLGTIAVEYQGKKYFVCCTGCRDLFNEDPAGVLEDYRQRKEAEKTKKAAE